MARLMAKFVALISALPPIARIDHVEVARFLCFHTMLRVYSRPFNHAQYGESMSFLHNISYFACLLTSV